VQTPHRLIAGEQPITRRQQHPEPSFPIGLTGVLLITRTSCREIGTGGVCDDGVEVRPKSVAVRRLSGLHRSTLSGGNHLREDPVCIL